MSDDEPTKLPECGEKLDRAELTSSSCRRLHRRLEGEMVRWILAIGILALAGCSAVRSVPTGVQTESTMIRTSGGPFSATYSGKYTLGSGCALTQFHISGSGSGSFVHSSNEKGSMDSGDQGCEWQGPATLRSSVHPRNSITMSLTLGNFGPGNTPCHPRFGQKVRFNVVSGTGRFVNATGSGTVVFTCHSDGTYTDTWAGAITF
jgi:hypothetical protein